MRSTQQLLHTNTHDATINNNSDEQERGVLVNSVDRPAQRVWSAAVRRRTPPTRLVRVVCQGGANGRASGVCDDVMSDSVCRSVVCGDCEEN